jgi:hypothetical protein
MGVRRKVTMSGMFLIRGALLVILSCALSAAAPPECQRNKWCKVYPNPTLNFGPGLQDNGWNRIFFTNHPNDPTVGKFVIEGAGNVTLGTPDAQSTIISPWSNSYFSFNTLIKDGQPVIANRPPWAEMSNCGDVQTSYGHLALPQLVYLKKPISGSDTSVNFCIGLSNSGCVKKSAFVLSQRGSVWVDDEVFDYSAIRCNDPSGNCSQTGATQVTFTVANACEGPCRGQRRSAGWTAATNHDAGAYGGLTCPKTNYGPRLNGALTTDTPFSRHPVGGSTYDIKRGRIWKAWGFQENWSTQDSWYLCIYQTSYCNSTQIAEGWFRLPLFTQGGANPPGYSENDQIYVPDPFDVLFEFGGLKSGATSDAWVFCLSRTNWGTQGIPVDGPFGCDGTIMQWRPVCNSAHCHKKHGNAGPRDGARLVYDPVDQRVLIFGGRQKSGGPYYSSVTQWNPKSGDYCLSDAGAQVGSDGSGCKLPVISGFQPPAILDIYFPNWAWDSKRKFAAVYLPGQLYIYDPEQNQWLRTGVTGGPTQATYQNAKSMAYDEINDMFVAVTHTMAGFEIWQLPGAAIGAASADMRSRGW